MRWSWLRALLRANSRYGHCIWATGAENGFWPDIHVTPEDGTRAHLDLQGGEPHGVLTPSHWATFNLTTHPWGEPGEGTVAAGGATGSRVALPRPGEPFEPTAETVPAEPSWRAVAHAPADDVAQGKSARAPGPETISAG